MTALALGLSHFSKKKKRQYENSNMRRYLRNEESYELFKSGDVKTAFGKILDAFAGCDRVMINLECAVTEKDTAIKKIGPNL